MAREGIDASVLAEVIKGEFKGAGARIRNLTTNDRARIVRELQKRGRIKGRFPPVLSALLERGRRLELSGVGDNEFQVAADKKFGIFV